MTDNLQETKHFTTEIPEWLAFGCKDITVQPQTRQPVYQTIELDAFTSSATGGSRPKSHISRCGKHTVLVFPFQMREARADCKHLQGYIRCRCTQTYTNVMLAFCRVGEPSYRERNEVRSYEQSFAP